MKRLVYFVSALWAALVLYALLNPAPAQTNGVQAAPYRHCVCIAFGPRNGCLRWRCRRMYHRPRSEGSP